jgi:adenylate kinase
MKKLILIIGAPGSGKTTDAERIAEQNSDKIKHYSTGDLLRAEAASGSERGQVINSFISAGNIVPIEIAIETIISAIKTTQLNNIIIDGYPRSNEQMKALDEYLQKEDSIELISVIEVEVSEETARDRVLGRARGADDNNEVFNNRMKVYIDPLADIQKFYTEKNLLTKISGEASIEEVVAHMQDFILTKLAK